MYARDTSSHADDEWMGRSDPRATIAFILADEPGISDSNGQEEIDHFGACSHIRRGVLVDGILTQRDRSPATKNCEDQRSRNDTASMHGLNDPDIGMAGDAGVFTGVQSLSGEHRHDGKCIVAPSVTDSCRPPKRAINSPEGSLPDMAKRVKLEEHVEETASAASPVATASDEETPSTAGKAAMRHLETQESDFFIVDEYAYRNAIPCWATANVNGCSQDLRTQKSFRDLTQTTLSVE